MLQAGGVWSWFGKLYLAAVTPVLWAVASLVRTVTTASRHTVAVSAVQPPPKLRLLQVPIAA